MFDRFTSAVALARIFNIQSSLSIVIESTLLAMGVIIDIKTTGLKLKELNKKNPASCLIAMEKDFKNYKTPGGTMDINRYASNCIINKD